MTEIQISCHNRGSIPEKGKTLFSFAQGPDRNLCPLRAVLLEMY